MTRVLTPRRLATWAAVFFIALAGGFVGCGDDYDGPGWTQVSP